MTAAELDPIADLHAAAARIRDTIRRVVVPEGAYLRDDEHLAWLVMVSRARRPGARELYGYEPPGGVMGGVIPGIGGIPIYLDATVPRNVLELRWPDGRTTRIDLP